MLEDLEPPKGRAKIKTRGDQEREYEFLYQRGYDDAMYEVRQKLLDVIKDAVADTKISKEEIHNLFILYYEIADTHERRRRDEK